MASRTLSTDEEGIIAVLKLAGYEVRYDINACRWKLYQKFPPRFGFCVLSDENQSRFFRDCLSYLGQGEST